jgi:hypothetical protein
MSVMPQKRRSAIKMPPVGPFASFRRCARYSRFIPTVSTTSAGGLPLALITAMAGLDIG